MGSMSPIHWLIVIGVALLLFGGGRFANLGKDLGSGIKNFKKGLKEASEDNEEEEADPPKKLAGKKSEKTEGKAAREEVPADEKS